ncbi:MAG: hypothetical protein CL539_00805 [Alcanivorax sp.]|jgi:O-antigen/teichoic acid export membrane protein|uniref:oligosaccharide flippase family protein n=1 Tax=Alcanivorax TaxID=59753 RepID=UPI000C93A40E|nr:MULTISPECIES: oligosaccharide flippase family protein [unclassified Alcanivorax]MAC13203.1 hypothetical protein [Alcanivorax sp.]|tara:strand:- start:1221 stop:2513 length:1293 start_codon:yes stop_codon:yes gene_type:complete
MNNRDLKNVFINGMGLGGPLIFAVLCIPLLINNLGVERFGILTLMWAVVSYFGLFDLGISRALTIQVAMDMSNGDYSEAGYTSRSGLRLLSFISIAAILLFLFSGLLGARFIDTDISQRELCIAILLLAIAVPAIVMTSGYRGVLEAQRRFAAVNAVRLPLGIYTFAGPALISFFSQSLVAVALILMIGRWVAWLASMLLVKEFFSHGYVFGVHDRKRYKKIFRVSGWIAVSNILNPLIGYCDRFVIAVVVQVSVVAYYVTPYEMITKLWVIPAAITTVVLPEFSKKVLRAKERDIFNKGILLTLGLVLPICAVTFFFSSEILSIWIDPSFSEKAGYFMKVFSVGIAINSLAHVPFVYLQAAGYARFLAKFQFFQLPLYLVSLVLAGMNWGAEGVVWCWFFRIVIDSLTILFVALKIIGGHVKEDLVENG